MEYFAQRTLTAVRADGTSFDMDIRLDIPRRSDVDWECTLFITQLFEPPRAIFGLDSWQALMLALRLVETLLNSFVERGGRLCHQGTSDAVDVAALLGRP